MEWTEKIVASNKLWWYVLMSEIRCMANETACFLKVNVYADEKEKEQTNEKKKNENTFTNWIQCGVNGNRFAVYCAALRFISRRDDFKVINFILIFNSDSVHFWLRVWESQQMSVYLICQRFSVAKAMHCSYSVWYVCFINEPNRDEQIQFSICSTL